MHRTLYFSLSFCLARRSPIEATRANWQTLAPWRTVHKSFLSWVTGREFSALQLDINVRSNVVLTSIRSGFVLLSATFHVSSLGSLQTGVDIKSIYMWSCRRSWHPLAAQQSKILSNCLSHTSHGLCESAVCVTVP